DARRGAAVVRRRVHVVALLAADDLAVAARGNAPATRHAALVAGIDHLAVRRAAVAGRRVAVVARLARAEETVAADARHVADAGRARTGPPRRHLANHAAAVAGVLVAVVARLAVVEHPVAALGRIADIDRRDVGTRAVGVADPAVAAVTAAVGAAARDRLRSHAGTACNDEG